MGKDFDNPFGQKLKNGSLKKMSNLLNMAVFPGNQGGPLMHVVAAKAVAFREALSPSFIDYQKRVIENSKTMANLFNKLGYKIISNGTDNHLMLIDLRNKNISGKDAEEALVRAEITVNKNMVPFDDKSPFVTSGIRIGTPAITTRGFMKNEINVIVNMIDKVLNNHEDMSVINKVADDVKQIMKERKLFNF